MRTSLGFQHLVSLTVVICAVDFNVSNVVHSAEHCIALRPHIYSIQPATSEDALEKGFTERGCSQKAPSMGPV